MKKFNVFILSALVILSLSGCSSFDRMGKSIGSNMGGGLSRTVKVYTQSGELLATYHGKIDIQENSYGNEVLFDLNGRRTIINNAIVISQEDE